MTARDWFIASNVVAFSCIVAAFAGMAMDWDAWGWFLFGAVLTAKAPPGYAASCSCPRGGQP